MAVQRIWAILWVLCTAKHALAQVVTCPESFTFGQTCPGTTELCRCFSEICLSDASGYQDPCESFDAGGNGDPHMVGFSGQKFDFTGENGAWYSLLQDDGVQINMRVTAPLSDLDIITYITGMSIATTDYDGISHSMTIYVKAPQALDAQCASDAWPCIADGALTVVVDGTQIISPVDLNLGRGVAFGAVNLPGECRPFGFEKYWARKVNEIEESAAGSSHRRNLRAVEAVPMDEWILANKEATDKTACQSYVDGSSKEELFSYQSEHADFQLTTPTFTMRLNYGKIHQLAMRDPTDHFDLPDHLTHQMNFGLSNVILGDFPQGILGETAVVRTDSHGAPIMMGVAVLGGAESDYQVDGPLGTEFQASDVGTVSAQGFT